MQVTKSKYIQLACYESDYQQYIILEKHANLESIMQIVTYVTSKKSAKGTTLPIKRIFCSP